MPEPPTDPPHDPFAPGESPRSKPKRKSRTAHDKPRKRGRGQHGHAARLNVQIEQLKAKVGEQGTEDATALVQSYSADVIRLAFKMLPKRGVAKLGKRTEDLLEHVAPTDRPEVQASLERALEKKGGIDATDR